MDRPLQATRNFGRHRGRLRLPLGRSSLWWRPCGPNDPRYQGRGEGARANRCPNGPCRVWRSPRVPICPARRRGASHLGPCRRWPAGGKTGTDMGPAGGGPHGAPGTWSQPVARQKAPGGAGPRYIPAGAGSAEALPVPGWSGVAPRRCRSRPRRMHWPPLCGSAREVCAPDESTPSACRGSAGRSSCPDSFLG